MSRKRDSNVLREGTKKNRGRPKVAESRSATKWGDLRAISDKPRPIQAIALSEFLDSMNEPGPWIDIPNEVRAAAEQDSASQAAGHKDALGGRVVFAESVLRQMRERASRPAPAGEALRFERSLENAKKHVRRVDQYCKAWEDEMLANLNAEFAILESQPK